MDCNWRFAWREHCDMKSQRCMVEIILYASEEHIHHKSTSQPIVMNFTLETFAEFQCVALIFWSWWAKCLCIIPCIIRWKSYTDTPLIIYIITFIHTLINFSTFVRVGLSSWWLLENSIQIFHFNLLILSWFGEMYQMHAFFLLSVFYVIPIHISITNIALSPSIGDIIQYHRSDAQYVKIVTDFTYEQQMCWMWLLYEMYNRNRKNTLRRWSQAVHSNSSEAITKKKQQLEVTRQRQQQPQLQLQWQVI